MNLAGRLFTVCVFFLNFPSHNAPEILLLRESQINILGNPESDQDEYASGQKKFYLDAGTKIGERCFDVLQVKSTNMTPDELQKELPNLEVIADESATININLDGLKCEGDGNRLILGAGCKLGSLSPLRLEFAGSNINMIVGDAVNVKRGHIRMQTNSTVQYGAKTTVNNAYFFAGPSSKIILGIDCLLSYEIEFRTTDAHSMFDRETNELLNPPKDIVVGDHCWIGKGACLLQGAEIPHDTIVGTRSVVTKKFDESYCAIAGVPARVVSSGVYFDRRPPEKFMPELLE